MKFFLGSNNIMIDLETLSLESDAFIVSIGAVKFFTEVTDRIELKIDWTHTDTSKFNISTSTIAWWLTQSSTARESISPRNGLSLDSALHELINWMGPNPIIWGNGASFDNVVLEHAYKVLGIPVPWKYVNSMCFRTMSALFPDNETNWSGTLHSAVDDAEWQARTLINIFKSISSK